jgi:hypothetical protein
MGLKRLFQVLSGKVEKSMEDLSASIEADVPEIGIKLDRQTLESNLSNILMNLKIHEEKLKNENADVIRVQNEISRGLAAVEALDNQANAALVVGDTPLAERKKAAAIKLLEEVEKLHTTLEKEIREAKDEQIVVNNFKNAATKLETDLREYDSIAKEAVQILDQAKSEKEAAAAIRQSEEITSKSANISSSVNNSIQNMKAAAAKLKAKAAVDRAVIDMNKPLSEKDPDIANALAQVDKGNKPNESISERIARLKKG